MDGWMRYPDWNDRNIYSYIFPCSNQSERKAMGSKVEDGEEKGRREQSRVSK